METKIQKVVQIAHVQLQPVHGGSQVNFKTMADHLECLGWFYHTVVFIYFLLEQAWKLTHEVLAQGHIVGPLFPLLELLLLAGILFLLVGLRPRELLDLEQRLDHVAESIGEYTDCVLLQVRDMLVTQSLVDFPEKLIAMLGYAIEKLFFLVFFHLG